LGNKNTIKKVPNPSRMRQDINIPQEKLRELYKRGWGRRVKAKSKKWMELLSHGLSTKTLGSGERRKAAEVI